MVENVRYAGLDTKVAQRLWLASQLLRAYNINTSVEPWAQDHCDLLVACSENDAGRAAIERARETAIPVLQLAHGGNGLQGAALTLPLDCPVAVLVGHLKDLLARDTQSAGAEAITGHSGLWQFASNESLIGKDVEVSVAGVTVGILHSHGRVFAASAAELSFACARLGSGGWTFRPHHADYIRSAVGNFSSSLEAFFIEGALLGKEQLPLFPQGRYTLRDWPDLGAAANAREALAVARVLLKSGASADELRGALHLPANAVAACLWGFQAAGLLLPAQQRAPARTRLQTPSFAAGTGLLARLAARFGVALG